MEEDVTTAVLPLSATRAAADSGLKQFYASYNIYAGPWNVVQWHVNVGIAWLSSTKYTTTGSGGWGPTCNLTSIPGYLGGYDSGGWCGVYNPVIANTAMPGSNFWLGQYGLPGWKVWYYMRYYAYSDGHRSNVWGGGMN
jgi:hypothetical protein